MTLADETQTQIGTRGCVILAERIKVTESLMLDKNPLPPHPRAIPLPPPNLQSTQLWPAYPQESLIGPSVWCLGGSGPRMTSAVLAGTLSAAPRPQTQGVSPK